MTSSIRRNNLLLVNEWNMLHVGEGIIEANSLSDFKRKLDRHPRDIIGFCLLPLISSIKCHFISV